MINNYYYNLKNSYLNIIVFFVILYAELNLN